MKTLWIAALALLVSSAAACSTDNSGTEVPGDAGIDSGASCGDTQEDRSNCGTCGNVCEAGLVCVAGRCSVSCPASQVECAGKCVTEQTDAANCGACGKSCAPGEVCSAGTCALSCASSLATCGEGDARHCANTSSDRDDCGACGTKCAAGEICTGGACVASCSTGLTDCSGTCRDTAFDNNHCGACGNACGTDEVCSAGTCRSSCGAGLSKCGTSCRNLASDNANCGACGNACGSGEVCSEGTCSVSCGGGLTRCGVVCRDFRYDRENCGACGTSCTSGQLCNMGTCQLTCGALTNCGGTCKDTKVDGANCGACGNACPAGQVCSDGVCGKSCAPMKMCGTVCKDVRVDSFNCGDCGTVCGAGEVCTAGACTLTCATGFTKCGTACVNTQENVANCGACGNACTSTQVCELGACVTKTISCGSMTDCGGVCKDVMVDSNNCGGCGIACTAGKFCVGGSCQLICGPDRILCGSACFEKLVDSNNCGTCGNVCANRCDAGRCLGATKVWAGAFAYSGFALMTDATVRMWGSNSAGQLGDGTNLFKNAPVVSPPLAGAIDISSGGILNPVPSTNFTCAAFADGSAKCAGSNAGGRLGNGTTTNSMSWVVVGGSTPITGVTQISVGSNFACARINDGTVKCWGENESGQLGDGTTAGKTLPQTVPGLSDVLEVRTMKSTTCVRKVDKTVTCWGQNNVGQVGNGMTSTTGVLTHTLVALTNVAKLVSSGWGACALLEDGTVQCWGDNGSFATGDGADSTTARTSPAPVVGVGGAGLLTDVVAVAGGGQHYCALLEDASVVCWGLNDQRQLGDGTTIPKTSKPSVVVELAGATQLALGYSYSCALLSSGVEKCWGDGNFGQIGDNGATDRPAPSVVKF